jgi:alkylation response protein AidB-like acyl-CoA dehydrogenase
MVGLMHEALQITLGYMALRKQFGQPIGAFQALQHRAASCYVSMVSTRATVHEACRSLAQPALLHRAAAIAKAAVSDAALHVTKECVQFHGAIGFTDEHDIGLFLRRAMTLAARQGNARDQRARLIG